jgi:hypothetical protein
MWTKTPPETPGHYLLMHQAIPCRVMCLTLHEEMQSGLRAVSATVWCSLPDILDRYPQAFWMHLGPLDDLGWAFLAAQPRKN